MYQRLNYLLPFLFLLVACNSKKDNSYALNENFDSNDIGWTEESTSSHSVEIRDGSYFINSTPKDSAIRQTSVTPLKTSFWAGLPKSYEITTLIKRIKENPTMEYGVILLSYSLTYRFIYTHSGDAYVTEYDYNKEVEDTVIHRRYTKMEEAETVKFIINVSDRDLQFSLNGYGMGTCKLKTKQWIDFRLFTSANSEIAVDYFRIKKIE